MKIVAIGRVALSSCAAIAMLGGCGGPRAMMASPGVVPQAGPLGSKTFYYTGARQNFRVPVGVTQITITAIGAATAPMRAGLVTAAIPVQPKELLAVFVGGAANGAIGGFNGGGNGGSVSSYGNGTGGGGASDVRIGGNKLKDRVVVAGGAGGLGGDGFGFTGGNGAEGGGRRGARGQEGGGHNEPSGYAGGQGGAGGTPHVGGIGGAGGVWIACGPFSGPGADGALGVGGNGGGSCPSCWQGGGGGGGGGYYGGGGGGSGSLGAGGGGGGGSGFAEPSATNVTMERGGGGVAPAEVVIAW